MDLCLQPIHAVRQLLASGEVSAQELCEAYLARIRACEPVVRAYITVDAEGARRQAEAADQARRAGCAGPLAGIPLAVKDVLCTKGLATTCGSRILASFLPPYDATVVARLRQAGAVILGKATMDEFAMGSSSENCAFGVPRNPWAPSHVCGGSSGGSAAAVSAGLAAASLGSDTGGSIRQPASHCGVVGLKPTYGRVSRYGLVAFASSLDQVGPFARDVRDCALMLSVMAGHDPRDSTSVNRPVPDYQACLTPDLTGLTVGVPQEYFVDGLDPEVERAVRQGIGRLQAAGARVIEVSLPHTRYCVAAYYLIAPAEASSNLARFDGVRYGHRVTGAEDLLDMYRRSRSQGFGPEVKRRIMIGTYALSAGYYDAYYKKASQVRTLLIRDFKAAFDQADVLASPVAPTPAWPLGAKVDDPLAMYLSDILTISANLAGLPGLSVPCGRSSQGLPIGLQLMADHFQEETLLKAAYAFEQQAGPLGPPPLERAS
ncbi:MAG: Asp-tRNA(Asn)/Glu-tRNA(Gln) amidotransferase subunit GatA [Thermodesulfobacteriota bacterium]